MPPRPAAASAAACGVSPLMTRPGAVALPTRDRKAADAGIAWHYGDPLGEQRAAERGPIVIDRWDADFVDVAGAERLSWLHALTTQHLVDRSDGEATEALWLSPTGHIEHWADVTVLGGEVRLRTEPGRATALLGYLRSMVFRAAVDLADRTAERAALTVAGRGAADAVAQVLGTPAPAAGCAAACAEGGWLRAFDDRVDVVLPRPRIPAAAAALIRAGARPAGSWAATALRIATRRPRFGLDADGRTLPNETPWLATAVHLHKGCYRGQETVARVANLGVPPRRLVLLNLDGSGNGELPAVGDAVTTADGRRVGRVGSAAQHYEDGPIALALVKRTVGPDTPLLAGDVDAAVDPDDAAVPDRVVPFNRAAFHDFRRR